MFTRTATAISGVRAEKRQRTARTPRRFAPFEARNEVRQVLECAQSSAAFTFAYPMQHDGLTAPVPCFSTWNVSSWNCQKTIHATSLPAVQSPLLLFSVLGFAGQEPDRGCH